MIENGINNFQKSIGSVIGYDAVMLLWTFYLLVLNNLKMAVHTKRQISHVISCKKAKFLKKEKWTIKGQIFKENLLTTQIHLKAVWKIVCIFCRNFANRGLESYFFSLTKKASKLPYFRQTVSKKAKGQLCKKSPYRL